MTGFRNAVNSRAMPSDSKTRPRLSSRIPARSRLLSVCLPQSVEVSALRSRLGCAHRTIEILWISIVLMRAPRCSSPGKLRDFFCQFLHRNGAQETRNNKEEERRQSQQRFRAYQRSFHDDCDYDVPEAGRGDAQDHRRLRAGVLGVSRAFARMPAAVRGCAHRGTNATEAGSR